MPAGTTTVLMVGFLRGAGRGAADARVSPAALSRLEERVAVAAARGRGSRPVERAGLGFVVGFPGAARAAGCALDLQRECAAEAWPGAPRLLVAMALHTGELDVETNAGDGDRTIDHCVALLALAHGGQILASRLTRDLVVETLPAGATFRDLGEHRLADATEPQHVYQLCAPDLPQDFPPLHTRSALPNNLPQQLTSFIGRDAELLEVRRLSATTRVLTLTGAGGCGKSRLAMQFASSLLGDHRDGAWWVDLSAVADPSLVPNAVAAVVSVRESEGTNLVEALLQYLSARQLVLVLDNCEHLLEACRDLASLLTHRCPGVFVLATSRQPLGIADEVSFRVPSLDTPAAGAHSAAGLAAVDSVHLFLDRAAKAHPGFRLAEDNAPAVAAICRRLDGIPLAIELAAARVRLIGPSQIARRLSDRFQLLTGGQATALPRQQTLEASIQWSYDLLGDEERALLARLSVFPASFDFDAAEDVAESERVPRRGVLDRLTSLVDKSLVHTEELGSGVRFRLLDSIRAFARRELIDAGETDEVRSRHLDHYVALALRAERELRGGTTASWLARLDAEVANLRAAMSWAIESGRPETVLRLVGALWFFWWVRGHSSVVMPPLQAALAGPADPADRAKALTAGEALAFYAGDYPAARDMGAEAVSLAEQAADRALAVRAMGWLAWAELWIDPERAGPRLDQGIRMAEELGAKGLLATFRFGRGLHRSLTGAPAQGSKEIADALEIARRSVDPITAANGFYWLGLSLIYSGRLREARATLQEGLSFARSFGDALFTTSQIYALGMVAIFEGDYERAGALLHDLKQNAWATGTRPHQANAVALEGWLATLRGDPAAGAVLLEQAAEAIEPIGVLWMLAHCLCLLGTANLMLDERQAARRTFEQARAVAASATVPFFHSRALLGLARVARLEGEEAEATASDALRVAEAAEDRMSVVDALELLGAVAAEKQSFVEGTRLLGAAAALRHETGYAPAPFEQGDREAAIAACREVLGGEFGVAWDEGSALSMSEAVAYTVRGRGERKRPATGWAGLTPTEIEVVKLIARGMSNPEIAEHLFVAINTVKVHVSHIFRKLDVSSRSELAAGATRRGL
jgi:predicted ATPase/DNA-binding CsgD family transcriptional regulator